MAENTKIQWADATFNPWIGCTKVSLGCAHCYAENTTRARVLRGQGHETWGKGADRSRTSAATWRQPIRWDSAAQCGTRPRVFPSLCDWLDDEVPIEWLADFLKLIHDTPNLDWLLLTKRPENCLPRLEEVIDGGFGSDTDRLCIDWANGNPPPNVWVGTSVENQMMADRRIPVLLKIPAQVRFLSIEPLLGDIGRLNMQSIDWVIVGGESGPKARPCDIKWLQSIVLLCVRARVPCFVKQLGSNPWNNGKKVYLDHPKGGDPAEWPEVLQIREFPLANKR